MDHDKTTVYRWRIEKLKDQKLIDFLPTIEMGRKSDMEILRSWMGYFRSIKSPYVVLKKSGKKELVLYKLWKAGDFWLTLDV